MSFESLFALFRRKLSEPPMTEFEKMREALRPAKAGAAVPAPPAQADAQNRA